MLLQLWLGFNPWPGNFLMLWVWPEKRNSEIRVARVGLRLIAGISRYERTRGSGKHFSGFCREEKLRGNDFRLAIENLLRCFCLLSNPHISFLNLASLSPRDPKYLTNSRILSILEFQKKLNFRKVKKFTCVAR